MRGKILVAEDDPMFQELLLDILEHNGFEVIIAKNGKEAIEKYREIKDIDLVLLDVMMPIFTGWDVLKTIKSESELPVIMLTALGDEVHEVKGLKGGANDYISKPFSIEILIARIENQLKSLLHRESPIIEKGEIKINLDSLKVEVKGADVYLNRKELSLLEFLMRNYGIVLSREKILSSVWGDDFDGDWRTIDTHIKTLRAKLGHYGSYIKTGRGIGYLFEVVNSGE